MSTDIKKWEERVAPAWVNQLRGSGYGVVEGAMMQEIAELRAALALAQAPSAPVAPDDRTKHYMADRLAMWLSASMDQHAAVDEMRKHIRAWLDHESAALSVKAEEALNAIEPDHMLLDFLDNNLKLTIGWRVGIAPAGNVSLQSIIACKTTIREAIHAAIATKHAATLAAPTPPTTGAA